MNNERIALCGFPKTGKTTLSFTLEDVETFGTKRISHTDNVISMGWSEASEEVSKWFDDITIKIIEGVAVPRALRKWLKRNSTGKPIDLIKFSNKPYDDLIPGQLTMGKGCQKVWDEIKPELIKRGVVIEDDFILGFETLQNSGVVQR